MDKKTNIFKRIVALIVVVIIVLLLIAVVVSSFFSNISSTVFIGLSACLIGLPAFAYLVMAAVSFFNNLATKKDEEDVD